MLASRLKKLRKERGNTQKEVAEFVEITERSYQSLESNEYEFNPSAKTLIGLSKYFNVTVDYLLGLSEEE